MNDSTVRKRRPWAAALLSLLSPGLGQIYNGQLWRGLALVFCMLIGNPIFAMTGLQYRFSGAAVFVGITVIVYLAIVVDAALSARRLREVELRSYNRSYGILAIFLLLTIISSVFEPYLGAPSLRVKAYKMSSGGMLPTLVAGDRVMVRLRAYDEARPARGDIIVFAYPEDPSRDFIQRVVALESDTVEIVDKMLHINGVEIDEPYAMFLESVVRPGDVDVRDNFGPITVPSEHVFTLGDNRDNSHDGRYWGPVPMENIRGRVLYIYWSREFGRIGRSLTGSGV